MSYEVFGKTYKNLKQVYETGLCVVPLGTLYSRMKKGWNIHSAISTAAHNHANSLEVRTIELASYNIYTIDQIAKILGTKKKNIDNILTFLKYKY